MIYRLGQSCRAAPIALGYVGGYLDGVNRLEKQVCLNNASLNDVVRGYVGYMQKHPKLMDAERAVGLLLALISEYPCRQ